MYTIDHTFGKISQDAADLFPNHPSIAANCNLVLDLMNNYLDTIYGLVHRQDPRADRPTLWLADNDERNALATDDRRILLCSGLIRDAAWWVEQSFTEERLRRYHIFDSCPASRVRSLIRVYLWRFIALHELYHLWFAHRDWEDLYYFNQEGILTQRYDVPYDDVLSPEDASALRYLQELARPTTKKDTQLTSEEYQENLTAQALELEADGAAVAMLVQLLMRDVNARKLESPKKEEYMKTHLAAIMGALSTVFALFDGNAGAKFELLDALAASDHPLPALRMVYAEEIADAHLWLHYSDPQTIKALESEWNRLVCDLPADHDGKVSMGHVFYYPAYTRRAQEHLSKLKFRRIAMYESLSKLACGNFPEKLAEKDAQVSPQMIWFDDKGVSLRGWRDPPDNRNEA